MEARSRPGVLWDLSGVCYLTWLHQAAASHRSDPAPHPPACSLPGPDRPALGGSKGPSSGSPGRRPTGGCHGDWKGWGQRLTNQSYCILHGPQTTNPSGPGEKVREVTWTIRNRQLIIWSVYSQQGLQGPVGLQGVGQVSCPTDAGHDPQVKVELSERARLCDAAADSSKVAIGELAAADGQQPDAVLLQTLTDVLNLRRRQQLARDLDGGWQHPGQDREHLDYWNTWREKPETRSTELLVFKRGV